MVERIDLDGDEASVDGDETKGIGRTMEHTERRHRHGGILYPLLLVAAIAVIVFSIIGIATMTGVMPAAVRDGAERQSGAEQPKGKPARIETPRGDRVPMPGNPRTPAAGEQGEVRI